jgi:hypothetical protein
MIKGQGRAFSSKSVRQARGLFGPVSDRGRSTTQTASIRVAEEMALELFKPFIFNKLEIMGVQYYQGCQAGG